MVTRPGGTIEETEARAGGAGGSRGPVPTNVPAKRTEQWLTGVALVLVVAALLHPTWLLWQKGLAALSLQSWLDPALLFQSALPTLVLAPLFLLAFQKGRRARYRACGLCLAWGLLLFSLLVLVPQGVHSPGWYLQPLLVLLVTCLFGVRTGFAQAVLVVLAAFASAWFAAQGLIRPPTPSGIWSQALTVGLVVLAMALSGAALQKTLSLALSVEEDQGQRIEEIMRALRHRERLLRHAMRVDTVGELSSMVVHQLRNQFQLILGHTAVGMRSGDEETTRHFRSAAKVVAQANQLLERLLGLARAKDDHDQAQPIDLVELCARFCSDYRQILPSRLRLEGKFPDARIPVMLDPLGLEHTLLNLVINAHQAIQGEGSIAIEVRSLDSLRARISIMDTGPGIPAEVLGEVFKPFFTTKARGKGTGLGLAAVQRFMRTAGGTVRVESEPGKGACFTLSFPVAGAGQATG